jgi:hypothetical protein
VLVKRVDGWRADLADRLFQRWGEFVDSLSAWRERLAERFSVGRRRFADSVGDRWERLTDRFSDSVGDRWERLTDRFADSVGVRWERLTDTYRDRRESLAEGFSVGWHRFSESVRVRRERLTDRFADSLGVRWGRLIDRYRAWRQSLSGHLAERRRSVALTASLCVVIISCSVTMVVLIHGRTALPASPNAASVKPSRAAATGIEIPDVRGMSASDARAQLERAGLKLAEARAAVGTPGQVLWTQPTIGRSVRADTPVTIVVGVEAARIALEPGDAL